MKLKKGEAKGIDIPNVVDISRDTFLLNTVFNEKIICNEETVSMLANKGFVRSIRYWCKKHGVWKAMGYTRYIDPDKVRGRYTEMYIKKIIKKHEKAIQEGRQGDVSAPYR